jgi:hypothetical protein
VAARTLEVVPLEGRRGVRDWLQVPHGVFADDPAWVPPLHFFERRRISAKHSPFFRFGEAQLFLAYRDGEPIGRISAHVDRRLERHADGAGCFGFFECANDPEAAAALIEAAADWLRGRSLKRMVGPLNFSTNEECGCLIAGFETPPAVLMPHARRWTGGLLESAGLAKEIDLFAYRATPAALAPALDRIAALADPASLVRVRLLDESRFWDEIDLLLDIYNDAWSGNWGFVPLSRPEIEALVSLTRWLVRDNFVRFAEVDGKAVGVAVIIPNFNEVVAPFQGRLLPFNWARLISKFMRADVHSCRWSLVGLRRSYQSTAIAGAFLVQAIRSYFAQSQRYRADWFEFSWVLESNKRMVALANRMAGTPAKTYRIYAKAL